jgi:poly(hydroxyalkanoate) depolymerase family esterase
MRPGVSPSSEQSFWQENFVAGSFHDHRYSLYVPTTYRSDTPTMLLVMLHGCTQTPQDFAQGTGMNNWAEQRGFLVLYPEQPRSANPTRCWNWFKPQNQVRGSGEPALVVGMVRAIEEQYAVDASRIYVAGISAGASLSVILGATYPDVFAAVGVCGGMPYRAASNAASGWLAMSRGVRDPRAGALEIYQALGFLQRRFVPLIVFHGTADRTVAAVNADQLVAQWGYLNGLLFDGHTADHTTRMEMEHGVVPGGRSYTEYMYPDQTGRVVMKKYLVQGMKHGWPGGAKGASYTDPQGPDASRLMLDFFTQHRLVAAVPAPTEPVEEAVELEEAVQKRGLLGRLIGRLRGLGEKVVHAIERLWKK